ncbi:MAG: alpha-L-fucosidase [Pontiellaceae bacterium]|nr:alpha-L-fucosidase [Pontiellaceae bacterium]
MILRWESLLASLIVGYGNGVMMNINQCAFLIIGLTLSSICHADNPIIQTKYTADPAPMVYNDTVYLYTSHDEDDAQGFKMFNWMLYSTTDMVNWTDHGIVGGVKEPYKTFEWADGHSAWAPQCIVRNGKFYLYCPTIYKGKMAIGVAVSDTPSGPFVDALGKPLIYRSNPGDYDPTVFIDDDGQAYMYWGGNGPCYYVTLNEDMISTSGDIQVAEIDFFNTPPEAAFTEGPWLWKKNNHYYLAYASRCCPEGIGYAMSDSPTGPWICKGTIMDPSPLSDGNHPGIIDYKGKSYVFGFNYELLFSTQIDRRKRERRSICVKEMTYNEDGTIEKVTWWGKGAPVPSVSQVGYLDPYVRNEAETICWSTGVKTEPCSAGGMNVSEINSGDYIKVMGVDFGEMGAEGFTASIASGSSGGILELHLDGVDGALIGSVAVSNTGGWQEWKTVNGRISGVQGVHDLFLVFKGDSEEYLFNIDHWRFSKAGAIETHMIEAENAEYVGGAIEVVDSVDSETGMVGLSKPSQGLKFTNLPAAEKLAIRYASVEVGTISVMVNDQPVRKVNVHSSGSLTGSFLDAIIDVMIPANSTVTIRLENGDVPVNIDRIVVGDGDLGLPPDIWNLPVLEVAEGPYMADWKELGRIYTVPEWWRDAKFGAWSHWDPQSMPEQGDWYARGMYMPGNGQYDYHLKNFGHPSEYGYKDICNNWVIDRWNPEELMELYVDMGARYFMAMGVHHDNFDCWDSEYQPWNSVNVGPKVDVVGTWEKVARQNGLRFGIGFHNTPGRTWGQFMTVRYTSDRSGPKQGVSYDALQTILDGKGKWWEGLDPVDLYGPEHDKSDPLHSPYANQFMWRVDDAITKYHPDMIYFDEHAGNSQMDLGVRMGLGFLAPQLIANYYNKSLQWNDGKMEAVLNLKGVGGRYNSFQNSPELLPHVDRAIVKSTEAVIEPEIMAYSFQTETTVAPWHYQAGQNYMDAKGIVRLLMENVCRNGTMLLNLTQHGRGDLDPELVQIAKDVGAWLKVNGEAVYSSRPFEVYGENSVCYTRNDGKVYAVLLKWDGGPVTLKALHAGGKTLGKVSKVELLGSDVALKFVQDEQGLTVTPNGTVQALSGISDQQLAEGCRVLCITHDKGWFNDDDPGATYPGWTRRCNLGTGDFNNDLTISNTPGAVWSSSFSGTEVTIVAPKEAGAGSIEIQIDGQTCETVDLSTGGTRLPQEKVCDVSGLAPGEHAIRIIHRGSGPVALDALIVQ